MDHEAWLGWIGQNSRFETVPFAELTVPEQDFVAVRTLAPDLTDSGFQVYYCNPGGNYAAHVPDALRRIGAARTAAIVEAANAVFGSGGPPADRVARLDAIHAFSDDAYVRWNELDPQFDESREDRTALLYAYVRAHPDEIHPPV